MGKAEVELNQKMVKHLFDYDKKRGKLIWKNPSKSDLKGRVADHVMTNGHHVVSINGRYFGVNRIIWLWHYGELPKNPIINKDGNKDNTRLENLGETTASTVMIRSKKTMANRSGVKGVSWNEGKQRYKAQIFIDGKNYHLGWFTDMEDAIFTRYAAEQCLLEEHNVILSDAHAWVKNWRKKMIL